MTQPNEAPPQALRIDRTATGYRIRPEKPAEQLAEDCAAIGVCIVGLIVVMALLA
ncbi:hypothetical protein [Paenibacillus sp. YN15]|uniref:hypothetical protein n=1 Tax=Paenibacillus sp. YN15 TaxID=1742774 RepID=UPI0015ECBCEF|nr:hypothetical protein [Paenibacillus sp. YN15]